MDDETRHKIVWGWLRLFLGWLQMSLAAAGLGALITVGIHPVTWFFVIGATAATVVSRLLYRRSDSVLREKRDDSH
jgi:hypothetical protein